MNFTEEQFALWSGSPSQTETDRMNNAESAVKKAIEASDKLKGRNIRVFAQGSYRNRVNVRGDSDVDVAVLCTNTFFWEGPPGATLESLGYQPATYHYPDFRREVGEALRSFFNTGVVTEGDKAFDISANSYRVEADVAPFFEHKRFFEGGGHICGVEMQPKSGGRIINWPDQHYENAVAKNNATGRGFKGCVRILKTLRYRMIANGYESAEAASSFLMECLIYNVPNSEFGNSTWLSEFRHCLAHLYNNTMNDQDCGQWLEVNELKWLFHPTQPWTRQATHQFISDCWSYVGYE